MGAPEGLSGSSPDQYARAEAGFARLAGTFFSILVQLLANAFALEIGQIVDEEFSLEVVHLVLQADGREAIEIDFEDLAGHVLGARADGGGALDLIENAGNRQAAFLGDPHAFTGENFRVAEHLGVLLSLGNIHDDQSLMNVHLGGRQPDAGRFVHGFEHVLREARKRGIEHLDRLGLGAKTGVRVLKNIQARHDVPLDCC